MAATSVFAEEGLNRYTESGCSAFIGWDGYRGSPVTAGMNGGFLMTSCVYRLLSRKLWLVYKALVDVTGLTSSPHLASGRSLQLLAQSLLLGEGEEAPMLRPQWQFLVLPLPQGHLWNLGLLVQLLKYSRSQVRRQLCLRLIQEW